MKALSTHSTAEASPWTPMEVVIGTSPPQQIISGLRKELIEIRIRMTLLKIALKNYNLKICLQILKSLDALRRQFSGPHRIKKLVKIDGKFYYDLYTPGWPSSTYEAAIAGEMNRLQPVKNDANRFTNIFLCITKKCPLQCEHCFEWKALNGQDSLILSDIKRMVANFQKMGTGQIQLTGGEPMLKVPEITEILKGTKSQSDFWVLTSGYNLTEENARTLKKAGLVGVLISLDHFDPDAHNRFRGNKNSYEWVCRGIENSKRARLVTAISLCATKEFISEANLMTYANLARKMGVSFIQILEPKAVGHYEGKDVLLNKEHEAILDAFCMKMNYDKAFEDYPIISYHGSYQRNAGCFAAGNRNLYVDTDGDIHACPFCHSKMGSALGDNLEDSIAGLRSVGCHTYKSFAN